MRTLRGIVLAKSNRPILVAVCLCAAATSAVAADLATISAWVQKAEYCRQHDGSAVFQLTVGLTYTNPGARSLIVPRLSAVSGYRIVGQGRAEVARSEITFTEDDAVSYAVWEGATPDPKLFDILMPGQTSRFGERFLVLGLSGPGAGKRGLSAPGEYSIYLELDHGPRFPKGREVMPEKWRELGLLLTKRVEASMINFQIPPRDPVTVCSEPPFLSKRRRQ